MCNCHSELTVKLKERLLPSLPKNASNFELELGGYVFGIPNDGGPITHRPALPIEVRYALPKKTGGYRNVKKTQNMHATYCPFCGLSFTTGLPATAEGKDQQPAELTAVNLDAVRLLNYPYLHEYANGHHLNYNRLCAALRDALPKELPL